MVTPGQIPPIQPGDAVQLVYALGTLYYDFGTEARRDAILQAAGELDPRDPAQFLRYLDRAPYEAAGVIWTLNVDATPIYAIRPADPYADTAFARLHEFLSAQLAREVELVAIPAILDGSSTLLSGQRVPRLRPDLRGMATWNLPALVEAAIGKRPAKAEEHAAYDQRRAGLTNYLARIYYEMRNLGTLPQERAMNFTATNLFQAGVAFAEAAAAGRQLGAITVERSPICRPGADCWDVKLTFFDPVRRLEQAPQEFRLTVDVSDVVPVTVGAVRSWFAF